MVIRAKERRGGDIDSNKQLRLLRLLLEAGANADAPRKELVQEHLDVESPHDDPRSAGFISSVRCVPRRETPLLMAIRTGQHDVVRMLVSHGADPYASKYHYGKEVEKTALEMAIAAGPEMMDALQCKWESRYFSLFPAQVRRNIFIALCIATRQAWPLPPELLHVIFTKIASPPFPKLAKEASKVKVDKGGDLGCVDDDEEGV